ncbi:hypothetical protein [Haladaptatus sp. DYF46]|uniref:hypothetical protein n=1 Tax=Haladaptatus sp. DYF46 TaxID=2886041 RepID=UPI001E51B991|nr:hypothetical protein [Haladaptatus sp. DYF46]
MQVANRAFSSGILLVIGGAVAIQWLIQESILYIGHPFSAGWVGIGYEQYFAFVVPPTMIVLCGGVLFVLGMLPWHLQKWFMN